MQYGSCLVLAHDERYILNEYECKPVKNRTGLKGSVHIQLRVT